LIDTDENLLFTLTKNNQCGDVYVVTIKMNNSVIFETSMKANSRVNVTTRAVDQQLKNTLDRWYLSLNVDRENNTSHAKVSL
jgi:flagellar basal body L-ring protein FlgH